MNLHSGARSCPASRALLIERIRQGMRVTEAARAAGISRRSTYKWIARYAREGAAGLRDRWMPAEVSTLGGSIVDAEPPNRPDQHLHPLRKMEQRFFVRQADSRRLRHRVPLDLSFGNLQLPR